MINGKILNSLKNYNLEKNKNKLNILEINNTKTNTQNKSFHGKKILISEHPLLFRNKFINKN